MAEHDWLAQRFEENRAHLRAVAYRMLGSTGEADDAVQEAWLRLSRSDTSGVENLGGWLTTVVGRVCLDALRSRRSRREESLDEPPEAHSPEPIADHADETDPEHEALVADSVGPALLVVLEMLSPAERVAFVLHDVFAVPFAEIAPVVGRSPNAAKMLASRARRRVHGAGLGAEIDHARQRQVVEAFLAASRDGDFEDLIAVLDPEVVLRADQVAVQAAAARKGRGAPALAGELHGAEAVAEVFRGRARAAQPAMVNGSVGAVWAPGGRIRAAWAITVVAGKIVAINMHVDPVQLQQLDVTILSD